MGRDRKGVIIILIGWAGCLQMEADDDSGAEARWKENVYNENHHRDTT